MSVREKAIDTLMTVIDSAPATYFYPTVYETLIKSIDWNRVGLEARGRCLQLHGDQIADDIDIPCGECIEAALLVKETFPDWSEQ